MKNIKTIKKLFQIGLVSLTPILFVACGGGGGESSFSNANVDINVTCLTVAPTNPTAPQIATYIELFSGDTIVKDTANAVVQIYTPLGQNSRVCIEAGTAHIIRK